MSQRLDKDKDVNFTLKSIVIFFYKASSIYHIIKLEKTLVSEGSQLHFNKEFEAVVNQNMDRKSRVCFSSLPCFSANAFSRYTLNKKQ